ncbi:NAD(P)-dependent oxidoreductase [Martelella alba]|uniref:NAD(P)-dependent oxidoreductase n=1 Tax=Martelella alba TaxID=2590451 RepID=A0A506UFF6_9HYPH|nr:NAD(P)-dependent oxidoreductase [Martelella alba]TPW31784.1 NAD(P)-dependent oxidoreductase [Martelella alba]
MTHILISGGTGLVGRYMVEAFRAGGHLVSVAGRTPPPPETFAAAAAYRPLTLDPDRDQSGIFDGVDIFIHAAFLHEPGRYRGGEGDDPAGFIRANLDGSVALFETARAAGVQRCLFLSSRAVYDGFAPGTELNDSLIPAPTSLYGQIKYQAEQALAALSTPQFVTASLRATGVYGHLSPNKWDDLFARYLAGEMITPRAASEVHGADLASAALLLSQAPAHKVSGLSFNATDIVTDTHAILAPLKAATACPHPLPARAAHDTVSLMTTTRLNALGWRSGGYGLFYETLEKLVSRYAL